MTTHPNDAPSSTRLGDPMSERPPTAEHLLAAIEDHARWCERDYCAVCDVWHSAIVIANDVEPPSDPPERWLT